MKQSLIILGVSCAGVLAGFWLTQSRQVYCVGAIEGDTYAPIKIIRTSGIFRLAERDIVRPPDQECNSAPTGIIDFSEVETCINQNGNCSDKIDLDKIESVTD